LGDNAFEASPILLDGGGAAKLFANDLPQPPRAIIELPFDPIEPTSALRAGHYPTVIAEHLEMSGDGALRELEDAAQLRHGELVALEKRDEPTTGRISERSEALEDGGSSGIYHPCIRIQGWAI
jgi:hypothetical protein